MRKALFAVALCGTCLLAADFWQSKPFTDWSDKDVQKMLQNSPWSKQTSVPFTSGGRGMEGAQGGRTRGGNIGNAGADSNPNPMSGPASGSDPGGLGRYSGSRGGGGEAPAASVPTINLVVRWQSSLPVREAIVKARYGSEAATSPEAKKTLEADLKDYIIAVGGVPPGVLRGSKDEMKQAMLQQAALVVKGKEPIKPVDFMLEENGPSREALFAFPKTNPITEEDKEVEFNLRIGDIYIKQKFRLKDMVFNGKLEL